MILLIDNYDSFSYNLYQLVGSLALRKYPDGSAAPGELIRVVRNDALRVAEIRQLNPEYLILSPGPGRPADAGICEAAVRELAGELPILGVCLGHQAICEAFGGEVSYAKRLMHGKQSMTRIDRGCRLFEGLPERIPVARYHSLAAVAERLPDCLQVTAEAEDGEIMAVCHREYPVYGLQFHPESIMTPDGMTILKNILEVR